MSGGMKTTAVQSNEPWKPAQPYINKALQSASTLLWNPATQKGTGFNPYPGSTVSAPHPELTRTGSGEYLQGGNPYFMQRLNQQSGQMADDINRGFSASGRYGSGAHVGALGEQLGAFRNAGLESDYNRERGLQMGAISDLGNIEDARLQDLLRVYEGQQAAPWNRLGAFSNILSGQAGQYGTQTTQQPRQPIRTALGALAGLGGLFL